MSKNHHSEKFSDIRAKERRRKIQNKRHDPFVVESESSVSSSTLPEEVALKLRIVRLSNIPREEDIERVGEVLSKCSSPLCWAMLAHYRKSSFTVYSGYSKQKANEIAWALERAGAKITRC